LILDFRIAGWVGVILQEPLLVEVERGTQEFRVAL